MGLVTLELPYYSVRTRLTDARAACLPLCRQRRTRGAGSTPNRQTMVDRALHCYSFAPWRETLFFPRPRQKPRGPQSREVLCRETSHPELRQLPNGKLPPLLVSPGGGLPTSPRP